MGYGGGEWRGKSGMTVCVRACGSGRSMIIVEVFPSPLICVVSSFFICEIKNA